MSSLTLIAPASGETQLVPVYRGEIGGIPAHVCKATDLHTFLEVGRDFSTWFKERVEKYGFLQDQDFADFSPDRGKNERGRPSKDYLISLDMAKELSMVENNAKGREARRYFIAMERKALEAAGQVVPASHQETLIPSEQQLLHEAVDARIAALADEVKGKAKAEIWSRVHRKFRVAKYSQLPRTQIMEAILYITRMDLHCAPSAPVIDPNVYERISYAQQQQLADAVSRAMLGWVFSSEHSQHVYNALRVIFHLEHIADLPAADFDKALLIVGQIRDMNGQFLTWIGEVRQSYMQEYVMAGGPWTPWLKREWKKQMQTALPARPHWIEIQQQLDLKIPTAVN